MRKETDTDLTSAPEKTQSAQPGSAIRGVVAGLTPAGEPLLDFYGNSEPNPVVAITTVPICTEDVGRDAVIVFENGDPQRPIIIGLVQTPTPQSNNASATSKQAKSAEPLILSAESEVTLKCGSASITLTRSGKVLINGSYVLTHSKGVNRIRGGSVQIN
jgi:hypothetical protein